MSDFRDRYGTQLASAIQQDQALVLKGPLDELSTVELILLDENLERELERRGWQRRRRRLWPWALKEAMRA